MSETGEVFAVEGSGTSFVHPLGLAFLIICGVMLLVLPRKYAVWPLILLVCFVSSRQCIAIFGLNFYFMRIMVVFGGLRVVIRNEIQGLRFGALDWCVLGYGIAFWLSGTLNFGFLSPDMKMRSGFAIEIIGLYFLLRILMRTEEDVNWTIKGLAICSIPLVAFFLLEWNTGRNLFAIFGGVPEITFVRQGRLRCQGAFGHPLLAGTFWASVMPLFVYRLIDRAEKSRFLFGLAFIAACMLVVLTASSTPILGAAAAVFGMMFFHFRKLVKPGLIVIGLAIPILHMVMEGPVWSLIAKIELTGGNSAYHRYLLIDGFINHWDEWFLVGSRVGTRHWGHFAFDTANQYVAAGVQGGIVTLFFFLATIVVAFRTGAQIAKYRPFLGWTLIVTVFVHCVCFFGISIWGQLHFAWSLPLAMTMSLRQVVVPKMRPASQQNREASVGVNAMIYGPGRNNPRGLHG